MSADFLLGRTLSRDGTTIAAEELYDYSTEKDNVLHGSIMATLNKKLLVNSIGVLFDLLGKTGSREAIRAASNYLSTALYQVYRHLYHANPANNPDFFSVSQRHFMAGLADADLHMSEVELTDALSAHVKEKGRMPEMDHAALARDYPQLGGRFRGDPPQRAFGTARARGAPAPRERGARARVLPRLVLSGPLSGHL